MKRRVWIVLAALAILAAGTSITLPPVVSYLKSMVVVYRPLLRAASLIAPVSTCTIATYTGTKALLYADRDYHTVVDVGLLMGLNYCRPIRHGNDVWVIDVIAQTTMYAIWAENAVARPGLWRDVGISIELTDEGPRSYRLKALDVAPGRHIIDQSFSDPTMPVFWDGKSVRIHDR